MSKIAEHLAGNPTSGFRPEQLNEIARTVYNMLIRAVRENSDAFIVSEKKLSWTLQGKRLGELQINSIKPSMTFKDALELIFQGDPIIKQHLILITSNSKESIYSINYS